MSQRIDLNAQGIRVYSARLYNHDYLWFSSFEIAKTAATVPIIHSYALSYAVSGYSYGVYFGSTPRYEEDLAAMAAYATPAAPIGRASWTRFTQNAINSVTLRTDDAPRGVNSPAIGWRIVLDPVWSTGAAADETSGFKFYLFTKGDYRPPSVMRLGKKGCPVRLELQEIVAPNAIRVSTPVRPTHAVNPLDVQGDISAYAPVPVPPYLVLRVADIQNDWFIFSGDHRIHLPLRFTDARPRTPEKPPALQRAPNPGRKRTRK